MKLAGDIRPVAALTGPERARMYELLDQNYLGVTPEGFSADLAEKNSVVLLFREESGTLAGFSTLMRIDRKIDGCEITAFFSGDTIIEKAAWGTLELPRVWSRHVFRLVDEIPGRQVYWFLISGGFRTYRFLPVFFREFVPNAVQPSAKRLKRMLDALAEEKFGSRYDRSRGIVSLERPTPPRKGLSDPSSTDLLDRDVAFFVARNPGWQEGEELACLAELHRSNLTKAGLRMLRPAPPR